MPLLLQSGDKYQKEEALISAKDYDPGRPYNWI